MKTTWTLSGALLLLAGCTVVPVPTTSLFPGILPQAMPVARANVAIQPIAVAAAPNKIPMPIPEVTAVFQPPVLPAATAPIPAEPPVAYIPTASVIPQQPVQLLAAQPKVTPDANLAGIADRLFRNETNGDIGKLLRWNDQDNFADLGLGHLLWYPANQRGRYAETFPAYLKFVQANQVPLPSWIAQRPADGSPWAGKAAFTRAQNDPQMQELRNFLQQTLPLQTAFFANHLRQNLPNMTRSLPPQQRQRVLDNFQMMEQSPGGLYPVLDYTLFQGDGANPAHSYQGNGWGLIQVLQSMENVEPGNAALAEFMRSADDILVRRVANAPADRREARLLSAWQERLRTYKVPTRVANR